MIKAYFRYKLLVETPNDLGKKMGRYSFRDTVEDCKSISVFWLNKYNYFRGYNAGGMRWTNYAGEETGSIGFSVSIDGYAGIIRFQYTHTSRFTNEKTDLGYEVGLVSTPCRYGGKRWWFICPLDGCGRRVAVLYSGGKYFGCRHCYDLTYESCQDSHKFDSMFKSMGSDLGVSPQMVKEALKMRGL